MKRSYLTLETSYSNARSLLSVKYLVQFSYQNLSFYKQFSASIVCSTQIVSTCTVTMLFLLSSLTAIVLFNGHCSGENVTSLMYPIFGLSGNNASHAWDNVYGSVIAADKNAVTVHLDCRPSPTSCTDQDATITAGPSTHVYTSSSGSYYAYRGCSKTDGGPDFVCSYHNHIHDSMEMNKVNLLLAGFCLTTHNILR